MSRGIAIDFAIDLPTIYPPILPPPPPQNRPKNGLQQHLTRENRSDPYLTGPLRSHDPRNPHLTRIFRDVCASKSSRSPPYAATRNFCTLRIFYRTACSIFGTPKFSTCGMSLICGAPKFSIWDMKKFQGLTYRTFRTSVML